MILNAPSRLFAPILIGLLSAGALWGGSAQAAPPTISLGLDNAESATTNGSGGLFGFTQNMERSNYLFGDLWGLRPALAKYGVTLNILETEELLGNATGGTHRGVDYDGLTQAVLQMDTQRAFGWYGGLFNISALQIHGRSLSADNLQTLQTASGIEGDRATRLWELWYQQKFLDEDRLDVKIGQQSLDQEFIVSQNALLFVNTMFGWPMMPSADLPGGGPAYPLSDLGVRARFRPTDSITVLTGIYNGSPVSNNNGDPQKQNPSGTSFPLNGGALVFSEVQWAYPSLGAMQSADEAEPLSRVYKLGFYYDSENFSDLRYDNTGLPLASPYSNGTALAHHGNWGIYGTADQMIWRSQADADRNINVFARIMGAPQGDRNLIDFSMNAGITMHEPFRHRDDDTFGLGMGYAHVSRSAANADRDANFYNGGGTIVRGGETYIEATYQYQATPWLQVQPDAQYVFNPGAGQINPAGTGRLKNELVMGVRSNILF